MYQQAFPDKDVPNLFGYQSNSQDRFDAIQNHYLEFPQLEHLGRMELYKLNETIFHQSDLNDLEVRLIVEQVGLLRKEQQYKAFQRKLTFSFPQRTIQEF